MKTKLNFINVPGCFQWWRKKNKTESSLANEGNTCSITNTIAITQGTHILHRFWIKTKKLPSLTVGLTGFSRFYSWIPTVQYLLQLSFYHFSLCSKLSSETAGHWNHKVPISVTGKVFCHLFSITNINTGSVRINVTFRHLRLTILAV